MLLCSPWAAFDLRWLPKYITIEIIPDGTEPDRIAPLAHALKEAGLPTSYLNKAPGPKSKNYQAYLDALAWAEAKSQPYATVQVGESHAPHEVVTDPLKAKEIINSLRGKLYAIDYETRPDRTIGAVALADERMAWLLMGQGLATMPALRELLKYPDSTGIAHSAIYEYKVTAENSLGTLDPIDMTPLHDTRLMNWVLDNQPGTNRLKPLVRKLLHRDALDFDQVVPDGDITHTDPKLLGIYAAAGDARNTYDLYQVLYKALQSANLWSIYNDIERPLTPVLAEMELSRLPIDLKIVEQLFEEYSVKLEQLEQAIRFLGYRGSLTSGDQLAAWFYNDLGISMLKKTTTGRGATDKHTLKAIEGLHPAIPVYEEWKKIDSLRTKFLRPILNINKPWLEYSLNQTSTKTGRLSCSAVTEEPNSAKKRKKREGFNIQQFTYEVRKAIRDPDEGIVMWAADYSQEEPRVCAVASGDPVMLDDYRQGKDAYSTLGRAMGFPVDADGRVSNPTARKIIKGVFLGWLYGAQGAKMQETAAMQGVRLTIAECNEYAGMLKNAWPRCVAWRQEVIEQARLDKASYSLYGRRELLPEISYRDPNVREAAEREAVNMVPQGTSADIIKMAMPSVHRLVKSSGIGKLRMTIHDENMGTADRRYVKELAAAVAELMERNDKVPLVVDPKIGLSWYDCK